MKIIFSDFRKGAAKVRVESLDDLWYLSSIIDSEDIVEGETFRKIKVGASDTSSDVVKKKVYLKIKVEKIEFSKYSNTLRVSGIITDGPEDVPRGSHHTFNVEEGSVLKIEKEKWLKFQEEKIREASSEKSSSKILICVFDREEAIVAKLKKYGYEVLATLKGQVQKKSIEQQEKNFYQEIAKIIEDYDKKDEYDHIILASPAFFKEYLAKEIKNENIRKKSAFATCSGVSVSAINEVLKRDELRAILLQDRFSKEIKLVEALLFEIAKDGLASYGFLHTKQAADLGAVEALLVTDNLIHKKREENTYSKLENLMKLVEASKGEVHIINSEHEGGKKLDGLGGIAAVLRYKTTY